MPSNQVVAMARAHLLRLVYVHVVEMHERILHEHLFKDLVTALRRLSLLLLLPLLIRRRWDRAERGFALLQKNTRRPPEHCARESTARGARATGGPAPWW